MNKAQLLSTVAATLLLTVGAASAQTNPAPERAPAAQQKAPAERVAPPIHAGQNKAHETTGQAPKALDAGHGQNAQSGPTMKGHAGGKAETTGAGDNGKTEMKSQSDHNGKAEMKNDHGGKAEMKNSTGTKSGADQKANMNSKSKNDSAQGSSNPSTKSSQSTKTPDRSTTGQGAASGAAKLSTEQRTKITTVFKQHKVQPTHLNVSISVGTRVPTSVHYYPLPTEVVTIYPEWRGYNYILVGDQIVIIDPGTHEIVAILAA